MRLRRFHGSLLVFLLATMCSAMAGCLRLPYPSVSYVPPTRLFETDNDVHVFRADIWHDGSNDPHPLREKAVLTELSIAGQCVPQMQIALNSIFDPIPALGYMGMESDSWARMVVRLYRPGWKTVELASWDLLPTVKWEKAETLEDEEKALDALAPEGGSAPGSTCVPHRNALLFLASRYLSRSEKICTDPHEREIQERMREKAKKLRELADE